jgi:hypothetical protein
MSLPKKKSLPAAIAVAVLTLAAGYFGLTTTDNDTTSTQLASTSIVKGNSAPAYPEDKNNAIKKEFQKFPVCQLTSLPVEAEGTVDDILAGGPYDYPNNDNKRFGNYEQVLPKNSKNYYKEYTVETPGLNHRGARRIVTGGGTETDPEVWLYTEDHYESFCVIPDAEQ